MKRTARPRIPDLPLILPAPDQPPPKLWQGLVYLGGQAIIGIPARDLEASELAGLGLTPASW
jgi:hypothetical protein